MHIPMKNPKTITCHCGNEVELRDALTNECDNEECGQLFNGFGQRLAPKDQWEEEMGGRLLMRIKVTFWVNRSDLANGQEDIRKGEYDVDNPYDTDGILQPVFDAIEKEYPELGIEHLGPTIHGYGLTEVLSEGKVIWKASAEQKELQEALADYTSSVVDIVTRHED